MGKTIKVFFPPAGVPLPRRSDFFDPGSDFGASCQEQSFVSTELPFLDDKLHLDQIQMLTTGLQAGIP